MIRRTLLLLAGLVITGTISGSSAFAATAAPAEGSPHASDVPWLLLFALALGALFTLRASRPRLRAVRVRPPKHRSG